MKQLREFKYQKPNEVTKTNRRVYVLNEDADHIAGIDLDKLFTREWITAARERTSFRTIITPRDEGEALKLLCADFYNRDFWASTPYKHIVVSYK